MLNKTVFGNRVYDIAYNLNIPRTEVNTIINTYISICREDLLNGHIINFVGLVSVVPDRIVTNYIGTTAWYAKCVSNMLDLPYNTVYTVISGYIQDLEDDLLSGKAVDIRRIVTLHPLCNEDNILSSVHAAISVSIKKELQVRSTGVSSVRAHTCKLRKKYLKFSSIEVC